MLTAAWQLFWQLPDSWYKIMYPTNRIINVRCAYIYMNNICSIYIFLRTKSQLSMRHPVRLELFIGKKIYTYFSIIIASSMRFPVEKGVVHAWKLISHRKFSTVGTYLAHSFLLRNTFLLFAKYLWTLFRKNVYFINFYLQKYHPRPFYEIKT